MKPIIDHISSLLSALRLIINGRYLAYFLPGIIIALIYFYIVNLFSGWFGILDSVSYVPWVGDELQTGVSFIGRWGKNISFFIFQFIILTAFSPFNTLLGEKLDNEITGKTVESGFERIITDIVRMIGIMLIGLVFDLFFFLIWNITIGLIFDVSAITPYLMLVLNGFWFGFSFYDFALERDQITIGDSYKFAFKNFIQVVITGLIFSAIMLIPYAGIVIAPVIITMLATFNYYKMKHVNSKLKVRIEQDKE